MEKRHVKNPYFEVEVGGFQRVTRQKWIPHP